VQDSEAQRRTLTTELAGARAATVMIEAQLAATIDDIRNLTEGNQALADRLAVSKDRVATLENEAARLSGELVLKQSAKDDLQQSVDRAVIEKSAVTRQLAKTEASLSAVTRTLEAAQSALQVAERQRMKNRGPGLHDKGRKEMRRVSRCVRSRRRVGQPNRSLAASAAIPRVRGSARMPEPI